MSGLLVGVNIGAAAVLIVSVVLAPRLLRWFRAPSLTIAELRAFRVLDNPAEPVKTFFDWRQAQWSQLAKGLGAAGVAVLLAVVGAGLDGAKTVTERSGTTVKETTTDVSTDGAAASGLAIGVLWLAALAAWAEAQTVQRGFVADAARATAFKEPANS